MKFVCCCLSQVINNLFHPITTLRCSNIDQDSQPNTHSHAQPTQHTHTHPPRKRGKRGEEGKGNPHHTTPRTTKHPLTTQAHTTHHTDTTHKGKEGKRRG